MSPTTNTNKSPSLHFHPSTPAAPPVLRPPTVQYKANVSTHPPRPPRSRRWSSWQAHLPLPPQRCAAKILDLVSAQSHTSAVRQRPRQHASWRRCRICHCPLFEGRRVPLPVLPSRVCLSLYVFIELPVAECYPSLSPSQLAYPRNAPITTTTTSVPLDPRPSSTDRNSDIHPFAPPPLRQQDHIAIATPLWRLAAPPRVDDGLLCGRRCGGGSVRGRRGEYSDPCDDWRFGGKRELDEFVPGRAAARGREVLRAPGAGAGGVGGDGGSGAGD